MNYGFENIKEEDLVSKGDYPTFGLNRGIITKAEFYNGNFGNSLRFIINIKGKDFHVYVNEVTTVYIDGAYVEDDGSDLWKIESEKAWKRVKGFTTHIVKSFNGLDKWKEKLESENPRNFEEWANTVVDIFTPSEVDVFLQYQKKITNPKYTIKFTEIQKSMASGYFIVPITEGNWKKVINEDGSLHYENEKGEIHKFKRSAEFMEGPYATQVTNTKPSGDTPPVKKSWG